MAVKRGTDGLIEVSNDGGTTWVIVASQQSWSLDMSNEVIDTTVLGAQRFRDNITTFLGWSISVDGFWDDADLTAALGGGIIKDAAINGTVLDVRVTPSATGGVAETTGDWYWSGQANVGANNPSGSYDSAVQSSLTFEGKGTLNYAQF